MTARERAAGRRLRRAALRLIWLNIDGLLILVALLTLLPALPLMPDPARIGFALRVFDLAHRVRSDADDAVAEFHAACDQLDRLDDDG